ncbi:MAG: MBL fold metallo-hydrolase [Candidatus Thorarchaeota archaeon]
MEEVVSGVYRFEVPTPFPVGSVNSYLIEGNPLTLIDTGPRTEEAREALVIGLSKLGYSFMNIKQILITHGHIDHFGLTAEIVRSHQSNPPEVFIHAYDAPRLWDHNLYMKGRMDAYFDIVQNSGVPDGEGFPLSKSQLQKYFSSFGESVPDIKSIEDGHVINSGIGELEAIWVPGHSLGSVGYVSRSNRLMFSGDHILGDISSNPSLDFDGKLGISMLTYFKSLDRVDEFDGYTVLPGHRSVFKNLGERTNELRLDYQSKIQITLNNLTDSPNSIYNVSRLLYGDYDTSSLVLALAETTDMIRILVDRGQAKLVEIENILNVHL